MDLRQKVVHFLVSLGRRPDGSDQGSHRMVFPRSDCNRTIGGIGCFDTDHTGVLAIVKIRQPSGLLYPRIPDNRTAAALFGNFEALVSETKQALFCCVVYPVDFTVKAYVPVLAYCLIGSELIDIVDSVESFDHYIPDIVDAKIGVQRLGDREGAGVVVVRG